MKGLIARGYEWAHKGWGVGWGVAGDNKCRKDAKAREQSALTADDDDHEPYLDRGTAVNAISDGFTDDFASGEFENALR